MGENCVAKSLRKFQFLNLLTRKKSVTKKKCLKRKLYTIFRYNWHFFLFWQNRENNCLTAKMSCSVLAEVIYCKLTEHYENFYAHENFFSSISSYFEMSLCHFFMDHSNIHMCMNTTSSKLRSDSKVFSSNCTSYRSSLTNAWNKKLFIW